jgi:hypothetical protein
MRVPVLMGVLIGMLMGMLMGMLVTVVIAVMIVPGGRRRVRRRAGLLVHRELRRRHAGPEHAVGVDVIAVNGEAAERAAQVIERQTGVEQRPERHVSGNPGEAIEVQHTAHSWPAPLLPMVGRPGWGRTGVAPAGDIQQVSPTRGSPRHPARAAAIWRYSRSYASTTIRKSRSMRRA